MTGGIATPDGTLAPSRGRRPVMEHAVPQPRPSSRVQRLVQRARKARRVFLSDKVAAAHMVYFLVSAALFMPMIGGVLYFMRDVTDSQNTEDAGLAPRARNLLERLADSTGSLGNGSSLWQDRVDGTENLTEAGIRHDTDRLKLSPEKLENLQRARPDEEDPATPFLDYPELKEALGLDYRHDFHLRMAPRSFDHTVDPYGARALGDAHVAYFGALSDPNTFNGNHGEFTDQAKNESKALDALGLDYKKGSEGFTATAYYPPTCGSLGGSLDPLQHGTMIADTDDDVRSRDRDANCLTDHEVNPYRHWFLQDYFFDDDGEHRFGALVFGTDVDVKAWFDAAEDHSNDSVDENLFMDFVEQGGTILFLDNNKGESWNNNVTGCQDEHCLFNRTGDQVPMNMPDDTNQMLLAPNTLPTIAFRDDGDNPWKVYNRTDHSGVNETHGFIPVFIEKEYNDTTLPAFMEAQLGATTSDRYGESGGTVVLSNWNLTDPHVDDKDRARVFSNLLSYGMLRVAYLDYGPELPDDRVVRAAAQIGVLELPNGETIEVRLQLYLWRS